jgi:CheY-like chemotaxis protein
MPQMSTILLVDNDPLEAFLYKSILERRFHDVQRVNDAPEALCLVEQPEFSDHFGLIVIALNTPGMSSSAFEAELHDRLPNLPVLILGKVGERAAKSTCAWVRFLSRPFSAEQILAAASDLLTRHAAHLAA